MLRFISLALLTAAIATPAFAEGYGVMDRPRPDYDAKGLPMGAFRLKPALDVSVNSDDNVFDTETDTVDDIYYAIRPSFDLASQWSRHKLDVHGSLTRYQYTNEDTENRTDWNVGADGRLDVLRGTYIDAGASYLSQHEPRYSPDEPGNASEPTPYTQFHASAAITHKPNRFGVQVGVNYDRFDFDSVSLFGGGRVSNDDRDERQYEAFAKVSYDVMPDTSVYLRGAYDDEQYDQDIDRFGFDRDSKRWRADFGTEFMVTHTIKGEVFAGYINERFKPPLADVSTFDYGANLDWYATELMTFHLRVARLLNDTIIDGASTSDDQTASLGLDWEVLRNVLVHANGSFTRSRFAGTDRRDDLWMAGLSVDYLINEYMSANAGYRFTTRHSNAAGEDFDDNQFHAGLHFQL